MREQQGEQQQYQDDEGDEEARGSKIIDPEPRIFGFSTRDLPGTYILAYVLVLIVAVICGLYFGNFLTACSSWPVSIEIAFTKLLDTPKSTYDKIREEKKKKKAQ